MDDYLKLLQGLAEAVERHRKVCEARENGLVTWHESCRRTWAQVEEAMQEVSAENGV